MTNQQASRPGSCRICCADAMRCIKAGTIPADLQSSDFAITDSRYGAALPLFKCGRCSFRPIVQNRPGWLFTLHYLCQGLTVPLNLGDSMLIVAARG